MISKYKLNQSELNRMKKNIIIYNKILPLLTLKQEYFKVEQLNIQKKRKNLQTSFSKEKEEIKNLISILSDKKSSYFSLYFKRYTIFIDQISIAGIKVPKLKYVKFYNFAFSYLVVPFWFLKSIAYFKNLIELKVKIYVLLKQLLLLNKELKKVTQRVNIFEKILIPETEMAIKKIKVFLEDEKIALICRGKVAKKKKKNRTFE